MKPLVSVDRLLRPEVGHFEPYLPGRSIESVRRELGLKKLFKLASNENALGPSPKAVKAMSRSGRNVFRYPDGPSVSLRHALASFYKVPAENTVVGAGSDELIEIFGKTFLNPPDSIVVSEHAFIRYQMAAEMMGASVISVPMKNNKHDLAAMARAVKPNTKLIFIANPNNPTGTYNTHYELKAFLEMIESQFSNRPLLVVLDEAYYEFAAALAKDYPDTLAMQKRFPRLVVMRTFSKAHALAGLRVGYAFAHPDVIAALDRVRPPFNVNTAAQAAAVASLEDRPHVARSVRLVQQEKKKFDAFLKRYKGKVRVLPSIGNFVLMDVSPRKGRDVFQALLRKGVIVRAMDEYGFPNSIRVTYGLPQENQAFFKAFKEVVVP